MRGMDQSNNNNKCEVPTLYAGVTMPLIRLLLNTTQLTGKQWPSKSDKVPDLSAQREAQKVSVISRWDFQCRKQ